MPSEIRFTHTGAIDDLMAKFTGSAVAPETCFINRTNVALLCGCSAPPSWFAVKAVRRKRGNRESSLCFGSIGFTGEAWLPKFMASAMEACLT